MKKLLLPLIALVILMSGCTKSHVFTSYYTVKPNQWERNITTYDDGTYDVNYYYSAWENADITPDVIQNGFVLVYYLNGDYDELLPYTIYNMDDNGIPYQERIEFDIAPGQIFFIIKDTDFNTASSMESIKDMNFKVVVYRN